MGIDCSNCKCTNREDEKILVIENTDKMYNSKFEMKKDKIDKVEVVKSKVIINVNIILNVS